MAPAVGVVASRLTALPVKNERPSIVYGGKLSKQVSRVSPSWSHNTIDAISQTWNLSVAQQKPNLI